MILGLLLIAFNVNAEDIELDESCELITYYSKEDWVTYYDFFDTKFKEATEITNSRMISANLNGFGPFSFERVGAGIYPVSYENIDGSRPLIQNGANEHEEFYSTFIVSFGAKIRILDMDIGVIIRNNEGNIIPYDVYIEVDGNKELVYEGTNTDIVNHNFDDKEISAIYIRAKNPAKDNIYELKYFKINKYQIYEHVAWTLDYIEGAKTDIKIYCKGGGKYIPYEGLTYQKSYLVGFNPSLKLIDDSINYHLVDNWLRYNDGLKIGISKGSLPDYISMYLWNGADRKLTNTFGITPSNKNFTWKVSGNHFTGISKASNSPYIETSKAINNRKVYFRVDADAIRCQGGNCMWNFLGGGKYDGHGNNYQDNAYDTYVKTYTREPVDSLNYIKNITYYLCDKDGNHLKEIGSETSNGEIDLEDMKFIYEINDSGIYMIEAILENSLSDKASIKSGLFYIDNEAPLVEFESDSYENKDSIDILIHVSDELSGILKWRYRISSDNGKTFKEYSNWINESDKKIILNESGMNIIMVEAIDNASNSETYISSIYKIQSSKPLIYARDNYYYKDEEVDLEKLLQNANAFDEIDGDISDKVIVKSIEYPDGYIDNDVTYLDTSNISSVYITYEITNSFGIKSIKRKEYKIVDNESYFMEAEDLIIYSRYISNEYLDSLKDNSIWINNDEYKRKLKDSLENSEIKYRFIIEK